MFNYPVTLQKDSDGSFMLTFPDVPEAITSGATEEEALCMAVDALECALSTYIDDKKPIPTPSKARGKMVAPSLRASLKLSIYQAMQEQDVTKTKLGRALGIEMMQVNRILNLLHSTKIEQLEEALAVLGKQAMPQILTISPASLAAVSLPKRPAQASKSSFVKRPAAKICARSSMTGKFSTAKTREGKKRASKRV
ncbi:MAG: type II toxin-antitoxin system HicB family antitoxin [Bdellovibrionales bacterium]